jgi:predicted enzyme related to lactoylglutathione lyase
MMLKPSDVVLYVDNLQVSSAFYQDLLGIKPEQASATFHSFKLSNGMGLGLKAKHSVEPPANENSGGELAFTLANNREIDVLFEAWQKKEIVISQSPTVAPWGYNFVALDPDGNRLRAVSLRKS